MTTGLEVMARFEQFAAPAWAEDWDHVGWQLGDPTRAVRRMLITLDVRPAVVDEAIDAGVDLIFSHHPLMFRPAKDLDLRQPQNAMYAKLLAHGITVYSAHTNLDSAPGGMNDWLAAQLGLQNLTGLVPSKLSSPTGEPVALGRVGDLPVTLSPAEFVSWCQQHFHVAGLRFVTPPAAVTQIKRVAIVGGAGSEFYPQVLAAGAQAYVTGDVSYHVAQDMQAAGLMLVDPGHHIEVVCVKQLTTLFKKWAQLAKWPLEIQASQVKTEPFKFMMKDEMK